MRSLLAVRDALRQGPERVLEVAAGGSGLAATLASNDIEVCVNDIRTESLNQALNEYSTGDKISVFGGNLFDLLPEKTGTFDLVIACEVIEHVAHPVELLKHLRRFIEPGGHLLLTTPNGSYFRNRLPTFSEVTNFDDFEANQFKPDADGHLFLFTPHELAEAATSAGFSAEHLSLWGTPLLNGHVFFRLFSGRSFLRVAYKTEVLSQVLPISARAYFCFAMSALLGNPS